MVARMSYLKDLHRRMLLDSTSHRCKRIGQRRPLMQETCRLAAVSMNHLTTLMSTVGPRITINKSTITLARSLTRLERDLVTKSTATLQQVTDMKDTTVRHRGPPRSVINNTS